VCRVSHHCLLPQKLHQSFTHLAGLFQAPDFDFVEMPSGADSFSVVTDPQLLDVVSDVLQLVIIIIIIIVIIYF